MKRGQIPAAQKRPEMPVLIKIPRLLKVLLLNSTNFSPQAAQFGLNSLVTPVNLLNIVNSTCASR
ncbi:MAG TPA: hypothetical protein PLR07_12265, partial [Promineifilum sp.]|nr:hypothetical protein [Promineifilum sp.]